MILKSILSEKSLVEELAIELEKNESFSPPSTLFFNEPQLLSIPLSEELRNISKSVIESSAELTNISENLESIILQHGRPALLVRNNTFDIPKSDSWKIKLDDAKNKIEKILPSVGRIEIKNHYKYTWVGTGWLVAEDVVVTNRHVAEEFAFHHNNNFSFKIGRDNKTMQAQIDFREEKDVDIENEFKVDKILRIAPNGHPDLAFLKIKKINTDGLSCPEPIQLSNSIHIEQDAVIIGYPSYDSTAGVPELIMARIFEGIYNVKRLLPGKVKGFNNGIIQHDCSTLGGSSGSVLIDLKTGMAIGIHFSGIYKGAEFNQAISSEHIFEDLSKL